MCDAPQTTEALAVRRSRVVGGGVGFYLTQAIVHRFSKEYGSRNQGRWKDKGQGQDKAIPEAWNWKLKGRQSIMAGGWWHGSGVCRVGAIVCVERPRNFQARKDLPLNGGGHARKTSHAPARSASGESANKRLHTEAPTSAPVRNDAAHPSLATQSSFIDPNDVPAPVDFFNWKQPTPTKEQKQAAAMTGILPPQPETAPPLPTNNNAYAISTPDASRAHHQPTASAPINLSLVEEDSPVPHSTPSNTRHRSGSLAVNMGMGNNKNMHIPVRPPSFSLNTINSPDESADLLYEYFPLGLDDWMPPVDAVYRPHVVHHTKLPSDPRDLVAGKGARSRRLYSADVVG